MLVLNEAEVKRAVGSLDPLAIVRQAFLDHQRGDTILPEEAALRWVNEAGEATRSLVLPGALPTRKAYGIKVINASLGNISRGLPRASGVGLVFDPETASVKTLLPAGWLSATRTAVVSTLFCDALLPDNAVTYGQVGVGQLGMFHTTHLLRRFPNICRLLLHDLVLQAAESAAAEVRQAFPQVEVEVIPVLEDLVGRADLLVTATTVSAPIVEHSWFRGDVLAVNVSLDDLGPQTYLSASELYVDDWDLVSADETRLLGRLAKTGEIVPCSAEAPVGGRAVTGDLAGLVTDSSKTRSRGVTVVNPFGCGIADIALYRAVDEFARESGLGREVELA